MAGIDDWSWRRGRAYLLSILSVARSSTFRTTLAPGMWLSGRKTIPSSRSSAEPLRLICTVCQRRRTEGPTGSGSLSSDPKSLYLSREADRLPRPRFRRNQLLEDAIVDADPHRRRARLAHRPSRQGILVMLRTPLGGSHLQRDRPTDRISAHCEVDFFFDWSVGGVRPVSGLS